MGFRSANTSFYKIFIIRYHQVSSSLVFYLRLRNVVFLCVLKWVYPVKRFILSRGCWRCWFFEFPGFPVDFIMTLRKLSTSLNWPPCKSPFFPQCLANPPVFQRLLPYPPIPLEFSIDILNRGLRLFFSGKAHYSQESSWWMSNDKKKLTFSKWNTSFFLKDTVHIKFHIPRLINWFLEVVYRSKLLKCI